ncbi:hypothetical protein [Sphaerimonospora thailandensis]|uniref:Uncharacterized protein n=1 Tax=Sphaerimonospora thailandensis TaxID=795644 RepID=A0A8J3VZX0_9ACTN|nr:hypothetical protein [Sphaerimonospora thailandensis]GIH70291.1 hypothetical protein Mth01_25440 [Sphaerimonospora thailandensis]
MMLALEAHYPCPVCGCRLRTVMTAEARINKRSLRVEPFIGVAPGPCPECGATAQPPDRLTYELTAKSAADVAAYRAKRWPELLEEAPPL